MTFKSLLRVQSRLSSRIVLFLEVRGRSRDRTGQDRTGQDLETLKVPWSCGPRTNEVHCRVKKLPSLIVWLISVTLTGNKQCRDSKQGKLRDRYDELIFTHTDRSTILNGIFYSALNWMENWMSG